MRLKTINTVHIQSHIDITIELPETGVVVFSGNNSNGKSVIVKVTNAIISGALAKPKERRTLITRGFTHGSVTYTTYEGVTLKVDIDHEAANTYATLTLANGEKLTRFLSDKNIGELVRMFGFHYNKEHEVSLNIHNDDDRFLFVDTKHTANFACLNNTLGDEYAEMALEQLQVALSQVKEQVNKYNTLITQNEAVKNALVTIDTEKAAERRKKMLYIAANLRHMLLPPCPRLEAVPDVVTIASVDKCPAIRYPTVVNIPTDFPSIALEGSDLNDVLKGVCPTCKRAFFS